MRREIIYFRPNIIISGGCCFFIYKRNQQSCKKQKFKIEIVKMKLLPCTTSLFIVRMTRDISEGAFFAIPIPNFVILKPTESALDGTSAASFDFLDGINKTLVTLLTRPVKYRRRLVSYSVTSLLSAYDVVLLHKASLIFIFIPNSWSLNGACNVIWLSNSIFFNYV